MARISLFFRRPLLLLAAAAMGVLSADASNLAGYATGSLLDGGSVSGEENRLAGHPWQLVFGTADNYEIVEAGSGKALAVGPVAPGKGGSGILWTAPVSDLEGKGSFLRLFAELSRNRDSDGNLSAILHLTDGSAQGSVLRFEFWGEGDGINLFVGEKTRRAVPGALPAASNGTLLLEAVIDRTQRSMDLLVNGRKVVSDLSMDSVPGDAVGLYIHNPGEWRNALYLHRIGVDRAASPDAFEPLSPSFASGWTPPPLPAFAFETPKPSRPALSPGMDTAMSWEERFTGDPDKAYAGLRQVHVRAGAETGSANGSEARPFATIGAALEAIGPGTVVQVHPGVYREEVSLEVSGQAGAPVVIRGVERGAAIISGADMVDNWDALGDGVFRSQLENFDPGWDNHFLRTQWLFRDGEPLRRSEFSKVTHQSTTDHGNPVVRHPYTPIEDPSELDLDTFVIDPDTGALFVRMASGRSPQEHVWEIGRRQGLIEAPDPVDHIIIEDLVFDKNAGWWRGEAALVARGRDWIIRRNSFRWSAGDALQLNRTNRAYVGHNRFEWAGKMAVGCSQALNLLFEHNVLRYSNWVPVDRNWEAGSTKFSTTLDSVFRDNDLGYAYGGGLWFDGYNVANYIHDNVVRDHMGGIGIFSEISWNDVYEHNLSQRNSEGFAMGQSSGTTVRENVLCDNFTGIQVWGGYRRPSMKDKPAEITRYSGRVAAIPGISARRVAVFDASMRRYYGYTEMLPQILGVIESNIVFDNAWNYVEDRNYVTQNEGPIAIWDNNFSERNVWWHEDPERMFAADFRKFSYGGIEAWREASGRDTTSRVEDPRAENFEAPEWAVDLLEKAGKHSLNREDLDTEDQLDMQMFGSAMAAVARSRIATADEVRRLDHLPHPEMRAYLFRNGDEWSLLAFTTWRVAKEAAKPVRIHLGSATAVRESGFLNRTEVAAPEGFVRERLSYIPVYYRGVDPAGVVID